MAERLAASLLPAAASASPSARRATVAAAASFPSSCSARAAGLRLRSSRPAGRFSKAAAGRRGGGGALRVVRCMAASDAAELKSAREDIKDLLKTTYCHPILVRLGWHDSGTYDKNIEEWPQRGGADGSLRFEPELNHGANADLFQLASATAIEEAGGPKIPMKYGRVDVTAPEQCPPEGRLPDAGPRDPAEHLREVFYRMGLDDKDMKFLSQLPSEEQKEQDLLVLPTDAALFEDPSFKVYAEKYAEDQEAFFKDYAEAHAKLSNLGAKFDPPEGFSLDDDTSDGPADEKKEEAAAALEPVVAAVSTATSDDNNGAAPQPEPFVAAKYSYGKRELSDSMKQKIRAEYEGFGGSPDKPMQSNYFLNIMILIAGLAFLTSLVGN
nr:unnamed protein product [Digitaria exilis]